MKRLSLSILAMLYVISALSQEGTNPFDLKHRLNVKEEQAANVDTHPLDHKTTASEPIGDNPFDIKAPNQVIKQPEKIVSNTKEDLIKRLPIKDLSTTSLFWLLIFLTLLLAVIINLNRSILNNLIRAWTNLNFSNLLYRDRKGPDRFLYLLLGILFYFNAGIFISHVANILFDVTLTSKLVFLSILAIILIYAVRHTVLLGLSVIFPITKEINQYSFTIHLFNILNGIVLLIVNYITSFAPAGIAKATVILGLVFILLQFIYRNIRGLLLGAKFIAADRVHFFLYLCTCEIIPLMVGYKLIQDLI
jgi:hypothetical protein